MQKHVFCGTACASTCGPNQDEHSEGANVSTTGNNEMQLIVQPEAFVFKFAEM